MNPLRRTLPRRTLAATALVAAVLGSMAMRADWPTARGDGGRTGSSTEGPDGRLVPAWMEATGSPAPAWAGEARGSLWQKIEQPFVARAADDLAPVPVAAAGVVVFGTTSDEVRCVERDTGRLRWSFFCGGPVRYAPAVHGDRVFVGSDDGRVQALDLGSGRVVWSSTLGPDEPWISGNGRLISPHPVRTGLLVSDGVLYATAGLFPLEGTYLVALDVSDGRVRWRRNLGNVSPQGYLVEAGADLIVPNGRAAPRVYRKADGVFRRELASSTGTLAVVSGDESFAGPGATGTISRQESRPGAKVVSYPGRQLAVTPGLSLLLNERELLALSRAAMRTNGGNLSRSTLWKQPVSGGGALIVAGRRVYVGTTNALVSLGLDTGAIEQTLPLPAPVVALAADAKAVVVSMADGRIQTFLPAWNGNAVPAKPYPPDRRGQALPADVAEGLGLLASGRGFGLWVGHDDEAGLVCAALLEQSGLHWTFAVPPAEVDGVRRKLATQGWLGSRASVVPRREDGSVPVADRLFNLVGGDRLEAREARRLVCPGPSGVLVVGGVARIADPEPLVGSWTHQYGTAANSCATEQALKGAPRLQWFGGHGPERMPDRHTRGHAPLVAGGLVVSVAENGLIGTDARNGTVRWRVELPESMRYAMPYDGGYVVLSEDGARVWAAVDAELWELDARAGRVTGKRAVSAAGEHWGWVARSGDAVFASTAFPTASRTRKEYDLVDLEYRSGRPLVCSKSLVRLADSNTGTAWVARTEGAWVNPTLCVAAGRVYGVEARGAAARADRTGRLTCATLLEEAWVVCLDAADGRRIWERPLLWPQAEDILGLSVSGDRLVLSCARSAKRQAAYHLRCWRTGDGEELWTSSGLNPVEDLFHGQQVKRPVVLGDKVSFESDVFELTTGRRWTPPGGAADWILKRPGHACGGMTGAGDGLLFRADNPTFFRFADGSFTRLSPTRPGCWLNILPVEGGVVIPEASASCICGYPIQASLGFRFGRDPAPYLPDVP